jgi:hypothetical protein
VIPLDVLCFRGFVGSLWYIDYFGEAGFTDHDVAIKSVELLKEASSSALVQ